jgi:putative endonuclease
MSQFFTYILRCSDGSYYVGITEDLALRVETHNAGKGSTWTKSRRPVALVYFEEFDSLAECLRRENQLKGWSWTKKDALVRGQIATLKSASRCHTQLNSK